MRELTLFEFQLARAATASGANEREQESYAEAQAQLQQSIATALGDIASLKIELEGARIERRQKEECEVRQAAGSSWQPLAPVDRAHHLQVLRKQCMQHPGRANTLAAIASVESEIGALELESEAAAARVEVRAVLAPVLASRISAIQLRKKQFSALLDSIDALARTLDEDGGAGGDIKAQSK